MKYYIIIDCGTTNTRVHLISKTKEILSTFKKNVGVKNTAIDGNNEKIKNAVKEGINYVLRESSVDEKDIIKIIASGMITSDVGLYEVPHIIAPAGKKELIEKSKEVKMKEISNIPITFIAGIKNNVKDLKNNFESMDIMRGEEVEAIAVLEELEKEKEYLLVLPGSHTKFIHVNKKGQIEGCLTTLTGELLEAITKNTIISDSVGNKFVEKYEKEIVLLGANVTKKTGFGRAAFSSRLYSKFVNSDKNMVANYLLGACLGNDIEAVKNSNALKINSDINIVVAGKEPLKTAIADIFIQDKYFKNILSFNSEKENYLSALGALSLFGS